MTDGFIHSIKVPRLYKEAAKIIQEVAESGGSIKQLVFEKKYFNVNALYALVLLPIKKATEIAFLLKRINLLEKEPRLNPWLAKVLISELLWGKKCLPQIECKPIQTILAYEQSFKAHLSDTSINNETISVNIPKKKPRYVRINTLLITFEEALDHFQREDWILINPHCDYRQFLEQVENLSGNYFLKDLHVPNLVIFPSGTKFFGHVGYRDGWIILQDKASCLPAHILNPVPGSVVLDMCAAPGMKTTQLAAMLSNDGTIYAVERDARRYKTLEKIVGTSGATCVRTINNDILACTNTEFPEVKYILVDPSCSGSGMTDRLEFHEEQSKARLEKLAGFQIKILRTALTRYPNVERVVYSTCSTYPEENEDVVRQVLETNYVFKLMDAKKLVDENWLSYGSSDYGDIGKFCLYAKPDKDFTNGFFVAVFERVKEGERNEFFNSKLFNYKKHIEQKRINRENRKIITIEKEKDDIEEINDVISLERHKWKHTEECKESEGLAMQQNDKLDQNNSDATYELHTEKEKSGTHLDESEANSDKKKKDKKSYSIKNADLAVTRDEECNLHLKDEADEDCIMSDSKLKFSVGKIKKTKLLKSIGYKKQASNNCELGLDVCTACDFKLNCLVEKMEKTKVKYTTDANTQVCNRDEDCTKSDYKLNCSEDTIKKSKLQRSVACDNQVSNSKLGHEICTTSDFHFNGSVEKKKKIQKMIEVNDSKINCPVEKIKTGKNKKVTDVNQVNNNEVSDKDCVTFNSKLNDSVEKIKKRKQTKKSIDFNEIGNSDVNQVNNSEVSNKDCVTFNSKLNDSVEKRKNRKIRKTIDVNEIDNSEVHDKDCTESNTKGNCPVKQIKKKKNGKTIDVNHVHHSEIGDEDCAKINSKLNDSKMWKAIEDNKEDKQVSHKKDQLKLAVIKNEAEKKESDLELIFKINKKKHRKNSHDNSDAFIIPVIGAESMCKLERKKRKKSNSANVDIQLETSDEYYKKKNRKETLDNLDVFSPIGAESTDETERKKRKKPKKNRRTSLNGFDAFSPIRSESISEVKRNKKKKPTSVDNDIQWMTNDEGLKINTMLNKDNTKSKCEVSKHVKDFGLIDITGNLVTELEGNFRKE